MPYPGSRYEEHLKKHFTEEIVSEAVFKIRKSQWGDKD
jgi:hypothetical protein